MRRPPRRRGSRPGSGALRLFFGVFLPPELRDALAHAQSFLRGDYWKRVHPDQLHVTLAYLGERPQSELEALERAGDGVARTVPAFPARLRGTGFFPNEGSPRVWFVKAEGEGFEPLAAGLRDSLELEEAEPFKAHVTLARKKGPAPRPGPVVVDRPWEVGSFALVRSVLRPAGPTYELVERFPLPPPLSEAPLARTLVEEA